MELNELRSLSYAVVDCETTGTRANRDRVMEIAVIHVDDGVARTALDVLVDPQRPIAPWVSRLTGIRRDMLEEAPTFADIGERVREALEGRVFVAHNMKFDWKFVNNELRRAMDVGRLQNPRLCTVKLARKLLTHLPRRNLDALAWHYEVPIIGRHRAGGDARATAQVLIRLLADARRRDVDRWDQLQDLIRRPAPSQPRGWSYLPRAVTIEAIA